MSLLESISSLNWGIEVIDIINRVMNDPEAYHSCNGIEENDLAPLKERMQKIEAEKRELEERMQEVERKHAALGEQIASRSFQELPYGVAIYQLKIELDRLGRLTTLPLNDYSLIHHSCHFEDG